MSLLQPLGLLGLLALPVIVLLHLLHERNQRQVIPSLELWRWLEREVRGPRLRRPPLTPVLLLQLLAAALLSLALARPRLDVLAAPAARDRLIILVDTSVSMAAADERPTRLAAAQARAGRLAAQLSEGDSAALISVGPVAQMLADTERSGLSGLVSALAALAPAGVGHDWHGALALAAAAVRPDHDNRIVIFTDGAFDFPEELAAGLPATVEWNLVGGSEPNQAVVALSARPSGTGGTQLFARLANFADTAVERGLQLLVDGTELDSAPVRLSASGTLGLVWTLPPGASAVELRLDGADALAADDSAALGLTGSRPVDTLLVAADPGAVERALASIPNLRVAVVAPDGYVPFGPQELTVFVGWLPEVWPRGGVLVFDPPSANPLLPVAGWAEVGSLPPAPRDPLFADVVFDHVTFGTAAQLANRETWAPALFDRAGQGLIWRGRPGSSRVVAFTFALDETNLARRAAFPILVANAVAEVLPPALPASIRPAETVPLLPADLFPLLTITDPAGAEHQFAADRPQRFGDTLLPGLYRLEASSASGAAWQGAFGANAGALEESDLRQQAQPQFPARSGLAAPAFSEGTELWPWLLGLVLVALLVEARLAWR